MADPHPSLLDTEETLTARRVWASALPLLAHRFTPMTYQSFILTITPLRLADGCMELGVPHHFALEWLQKRCEAHLRAVLETVAGCPLEIRYRLVPAPQPPISEDPGPPCETPQSTKQRRNENDRHAEALANMHNNLCAQLDPALSFDTFVVGPTNRLAYSAALAVADGPGAAYNPLFIYGPSGLGKTHLLHSIAQRILAANPSLRVLLIDAETFTHAYVNALRDKQFDMFRRYFRSVDVWLLDDIQTLASREHTREEFFHTFNALYQCRRQIVLTSDKTPRELHAMDDRIRSRLEAGLIADINPPSLETRLAILDQHCRSQGWQVPHDVLHFIAEAIQSNVRALFGAVTRLVAYSSVLRAPMDLQLAQTVLTEFFIDKRAARFKRGPSLSDVVHAVAEAYSLPPEALTGKRRDARTALARQVAMYLARELCQESCKAIGAFLGGRDHTTVQRGAQKVEAQLLTDEELRGMVQSLRAKLCT